MEAGSSPQSYLQPRCSRRQKLRWKRLDHAIAAALQRHACTTHHTHSSERSVRQHAAPLMQMPPVQAAAFTAQAQRRRQPSSRLTNALNRSRHTGATAIPSRTNGPKWEPHLKRSKPTMPSTSPGPPLTSPSRSIVIITGSRMVRGPSDQEAALMKRAGTCRA